MDKINSWLIFNITPDYSKLNISDSVTIKASWTNNIDLIGNINLLPVFNVTFTTSVNGKQIVEDVKGFKTKEYVIKRKLMLYVRGIRIHEI